MGRGKPPAKPVIKTVDDGHVNTFITTEEASKRYGMSSSWYKSLIRRGLLAAWQDRYRTYYVRPSEAQRKARESC